MLPTFTASRPPRMTQRLDVTGHPTITEAHVAVAAGEPTSVLLLDAQGGTVADESVRLLAVIAGTRLMLDEWPDHPLLTAERDPAVEIPVLR